MSDNSVSSRKMPCPRQMYNNLMCIAISISVVTSQDILEMRSGSACYGPAVGCAHTNISCKTDEKVLISDISYKGKNGNCGNSCPKNSCCRGEINLADNDIQNLNKSQIHQLCSGKQYCTLLVPNYRLTTGGKVTTMNVQYYCIGRSNIINYCDEVIHVNTTVHIMYNGQQDNYVNRDCYCSIQADYDIDLYSVDIRLQKQDSTNLQCINTTLKWGFNQTENVEKCIHSGDNSTIRQMNKSKNIKDMWVQLSIQDENPTMVWIAATATRGKVNVTCGQRNVNIVGTTTTLSTTSHTTTINTKTPNISSGITSKSNSASTTVTGSTMSPTVSTTVQLHEPSANTTVAAIGHHSQNTVSDDDTNIGAIVGPVIAIIIMAVLVVIVLVLLIRRRAKQHSSQSTITCASEDLIGSTDSRSENKASAYDIISDYDTSKPIVLPTGSKVANGEPVALSSSFGDSYTRGNGNAISDVVNDMYSDINLKDMVSDDPRMNVNFESNYNHLHGLKACEADAQSGNVYSHLKTSRRNTSPRNDGYDHFGCNKPNTLKDNNVSSLFSNDYDHLSSAKTNNITDCNQPITTHIQQTTTKDATVKTSGNINTPEGFCTDTTSQQIEPSGEYAKVKRGKPVAASDYENTE